MITTGICKKHTYIIKYSFKMRLESKRKEMVRKSVTDSNLERGRNGSMAGKSRERKGDWRA